MPNYKAWIYSINFSILAFEIILALFVHRTITHPWWRLIPIYLEDANIRIYGLLMIVQVFTCLCGLGGVWFSKLILLKLYWIFMIPLTILDLVMLLPLVDQVGEIHGTFEQHLQNTVVEQIRFDNQCCPTWLSIQEDYGCCAPTRIQAYCTHLVKENSSNVWDVSEACYSPEAIKCNDDLLRWMVLCAEQVGLIIYYILFPLKCVVVIVLREDIEQIFSRRAFSLRSRDCDTDDEDDFDFARHLAARRARNRNQEEEEESNETQKVYGA